MLRPAVDSTDRSLPHSGSAAVTLKRVPVLLLILTILLPARTLALDPANPDAGAAARQLLNYLESIYQKKTITGFATLDIDASSYFGNNYGVTGVREGIQALDMQWYDLSAGSMQQLADRCHRAGTILSFQYHWFFNGESAWTNERTNAVDVGRMVTDGTPEHTAAMLELARVADALQVLNTNNVAVLWRPLHEISGGWFWWTDPVQPTNTAALYRMIFNYFTCDRHLTNLLWVWNTGGNFDPRFYPGDQYVDLVGDDIYNTDFRNERHTYWNSWNALHALAPGKMIALCECGALPNPDLMQAGATPPWVYALMWYGAGIGGNSPDWDVYAMRHDWMITRDKLPPLGAAGNISPQVGILSPLDDGEGRFAGSFPVIKAYAKDLDGTIVRVEFYADSNWVSTLTAPPYDFIYSNAAPGIHNVHVIAYDNAGATTKSQTVRVSHAVSDLAHGRPTVSSSVGSGSAGAKAVDGTYFTSWLSDNGTSNPEDQWIYVDLGTNRGINEVDLSWHWKIFGQAYTIDVATEVPETASSWSTVYQVQDAPLDEYPDKAFHKVLFPPVSARYVRLHATRRIQGQTWGGYDLAALEVPVPSSTFGTNLPPVISSPATATPPSGVSYASQLHVAAADANLDYLTYTWTVAGGNPTGITFNPNGTIFAHDTTVTLDRPGTFTLRVTVTDGRGGSAFSDVAVAQQAFDGAIGTDDRSSQSGNGLGTLDAVSRWNTFALRFALEKHMLVQSATLRIFRDPGDTAPMVATIAEGSSDNWNETNGPVPSAGAAVSSQNVGGGGVWMAFDVTDFVRDRAGSTGVATFVLSTDQGSWNTQVHTLNNANNPPQLVIVKSPLLVSGVLSNNQLRLSWPVGVAGAGLYWTTNLSSAHWMPVTNPAQSDGTNFSLTIPIAFVVGFFQLRGQP
jgi:mannan endo-1,4-beta-mannosidase